MSADDPPRPAPTGARDLALLATDLRLPGVSTMDGEASAAPAAGTVAEPGGRGVPIRRYALLERLGEGGMGVVYVAYDARLDRKVALKVLRHEESAAARARFTREARALARLSHPNVVTVHDAGEVDERPYLAMALVDGASLREWLAEQPRSWHEIVAAFRAAGEGLAAAHAAGLVHRDVKPSNILVARDGSVQVADFGLVRMAGDRDAGEPALAAGTPSPDAITRANGAVGTPRYMAPEQEHGVADARSDQYSFCVSLREALSGVAAPAFLRDVIDRGTRPRPEDRYPGMDALLAELARDPAATWRRRGIAAAALLATAAIAVLSWRLATPGDPCAGAANKLTGVWDDATRDAVRAHFLASGKPYAADTFERLAGRLGGYAQDWVAMRTDACAASSVRHEQSPALLDLRMECLDRRLAGMAALASVLRQAEPAPVDRAVAAAAQLEPISGCADREALTVAYPPPVDPAAREEVGALGGRIATLRALESLGDYKRAAALTPAVLADARRLDHPPAELDALLAAASVQGRQRDAVGQAASLRRALLAAARARDDVGLARAYVALIRSLGSPIGNQPAEALAQVDGAQAAVLRAGGGAQLQGQLLHAIGVARHQGGDLRGSQVDLELAVAVIAAAPQPDELGLASVMNGLGTTLFDAGQLTGARAQYEQALAIDERVLGPANPTVAGAQFNIAGVLHKQGDDAEARRRYTLALAIWEAAEGPEGVDVAMASYELGELASDSGDDEEAERRYQRSLAIREKRLGPDHAALIPTLLSMGALLESEGQHADAERTLRRALAIAEKARGPEHPDVASVLSVLTDLLIATGRAAEAQPLVERELAIYEQAEGKDHPDLAAPLQQRAGLRAAAGQTAAAEADYRRALAIVEQAVPNTGQVAHAAVQLAGFLLAAGRAAEAVPLGERAVAIYAVKPARPEERGAARFALARALAGSHGDLARAHELAVQALADFRAARGAEARVKEVEAWAAGGR